MSGVRISMGGSKMIGDAGGDYASRRGIGYEMMMQTLKLVMVAVFR